MSGQAITVIKTVWRKGWRREAAATQVAAADLAIFIHGLERDGLTAADADIFRRAAMKHGARNSRAIILTALGGWRARREVLA